MALLSIVPTPIGNLQDITFRAVEVLRAADLILAEDTRTSSVLLKHYAISKPMRSLHKFNEYAVAREVARRIREEDQNAALISDAGTPGINDPGYLLVQACVEEEVPVTCLPGPTAFVPALVASGLPTERFCYEGFLPVKKGRKTRLEELAQETRTVILYEAPHRLLKTLQELREHLGVRRASVSREISKKFEETLRGSLDYLIEHFTQTPPKGEFVIVVQGKTKEKKSKQNVETDRIITKE